MTLGSLDDIDDNDGTTPVRLGIVPREEITHPGFRFSSASDTIYLHNELDRVEMARFQYNAWPGELKTENIQYLAVRLESRQTVLNCLIHYKLTVPHFSPLPSLKELIIVVDHDLKTAQSVFRANFMIGRVPRFQNMQVLEQCLRYCIADYVGCHLRQYLINDEIRIKRSTFPVLKVMTEEMLFKYVETGENVTPLLDISLDPFSYTGFDDEKFAALYDPDSD
jgi:hypothetical protein